MRPARLGADVDAGRAAEAHVPRPLLQRESFWLVEAEADVVEVRVAGGRERGRELHGLVAVRIPVPERLSVDSRLPVHWISSSGLEQPLRQGRERGHRLERRARRVEPGDRTVEHRVVRLGLASALESSASTRADEDGRVEASGWTRARGSRRSTGPSRRWPRRSRPTRRCRARAGCRSDRVLGGPLKIRVDRQADGVARLWELARLRARSSPARARRRDLADAGLAAQVRVVRRLHAGLADAIAARVAAASSASSCSARSRRRSRAGASRASPARSGEAGSGAICTPGNSVWCSRR